MRVDFCGVRGSTPSPGAAFLRYGGQTSCVALRHDGDAAPTLLLDAGTGMINVTALCPDSTFRGSVLLSHLHWDHTHGMPFFAGAYADGHRVDVRIPQQGEDAEQELARCMSPPNFPIEPAELGPGWSFTGIDEGHCHVEGFDVLAREIPHKGGRTFGYRVSDGTATIAYLPDHSPTSLGPGPDGLGERHPAALELCRDADLVITDAQHRAAQFPGVAFLGHASPEYDVELAREARARTLVLFHHAPTRTDDEVDEITRDAQALAAGGPEVLAAYEGLTLDAGRRAPSRTS